MYNNTHEQVQNEVEKFEKIFNQHKQYEFEVTLRELNSIEGAETMDIEWTGEDINDEDLIEF